MFTHRTHRDWTSIENSDMKGKAVCRLCNEIAKLQNSHIMPRFAIKFIRDKKLKHRFYEIFGKQKRIIQDGPKEYLLCTKCEQQIGKYEKYFKEAIYRNKHGVKRSHDGQSFVIENFEYKKIKLFFLSLLWRASISSRAEFENVSLDYNEDILRKMIAEENPGHSSKFSISAIVPLINGKYYEGWGTVFFDLKYEQTDIYSIVIGGILYAISMDNKTILSTEELVLNESGYWIIPLGDAWEIQCLRDTIKYNFNK